MSLNKTDHSADGARVQITVWMVQARVCSVTDHSADGARVQCH